jgi:hypothetical protein
VAFININPRENIITRDIAIETNLEFRVNKISLLD